jgi:hypothetical protein
MEDVMESKSLASLPDPDYKNHPAYGRCFGQPSLLERTLALLKFLPYFSAYLVYGFSNYRDRRKRLSSRYSVTDASPLLLSLIRDGVTALRLEQDDKRIVHQHLTPFIKSLSIKHQNRIKRAQVPWKTFIDKGFKAAYFAHENNRLHGDLYVPERDVPELFASLRSILKSNGVIDAADQYLGRSVDVQFLRLTVRDAKYFHRTKKIRDVDFNPAARHLHIDHMWTVKCILYLSHVEPQNGPFCYCIGSHKLHIGWIESIVRRANDRAMLSSLKPRWRRLFSALPTTFQKKAKFGNDLIKGSPKVKHLMMSERCFISRDGDLVVFDDKGAHRGGLVQHGTRWALQIRLG